MLINKYQAKHYPAKPSYALEMFRRLAMKTRETLGDKKILIIAFAETATAIGLEVARELSALCMQTTRQSIDGVDYLFFLEEHSHATEQRIVLKEVANVINDVDYIVYVEDELTTGNTITNATRVIRNTFKDTETKFAVAYLYDNLEPQYHEKLNQDGITTIPLIPKQNLDEVHNIRKITQKPDEFYDKKPEYTTIKTDYVLNTRHVHKGQSIEDITLKANEELSCYLGENQNILVIGTEEFTYPALSFGKFAEEKGNNVLVHATTRSPIIPSNDKDYWITKRHSLPSLYNEKIRTFIYNLDKYDKVFVITDAQIENNKGFDSLMSAIAHEGNQNVITVLWRQNEK